MTKTCPRCGEDEKMLRLYAAGVKIKDIAGEIGLAANTVGQRLKRLGVERPTKPQKRWYEFDDATAVELWDHGLSTSAIAERLGTSPERIGKALREAGRDIAGARRQRYDGDGGTISRGQGLQRVASRA